MAFYKPVSIKQWIQPRIYRHLGVQAALRNKCLLTPLGRTYTDGCHVDCSLTTLSHWLEGANTCIVGIPMSLSSTYYVVATEGLLDLYKWWLRTFPEHTLLSFCNLVEFLT